LPILSGGSGHVSQIVAEARLPENEVGNLP
jgi:hypothetical protein